MTDETQKKTLFGFLLTVALLVGVILGAGVSWGEQGQRIAGLEREIREVAEIRAVILRVDRNLAAFEQMTRDHSRRLDRLEDRQ